MTCFSVIGLKDKILADIQDTGLAHQTFPFLASKMAEYIMKSKSDNTVSKYFYSNIFKGLEQFIVSKGGIALPASPIHIALYLTDLLDKNKSESVLTSALYGIEWVHKVRGLNDLMDNIFVTNLVKAYKRISKKIVRKKQPITSDMIKALCARCATSNELLEVRDL